MGSIRSDPAEHDLLLRFFYRDWRPTRMGRWVNWLNCWWSGLGLPPRFQAALEVRGRTSGRTRSNPVVIATVEGERYLVSMLGPGSDWVKNVEAAHGEAVIRQGRRHPVHLVAVAPAQRAPIIREYVRIALSGRQHFPVAVDAPLSEFQAIAEHYPVYRIVPTNQAVQLWCFAAVWNLRRRARRSAFNSQKTLRSSRSAGILADAVCGECLHVPHRSEYTAARACS